MQTTKKISPRTLPFLSYLFCIAIFASAVALPFASHGGGVVSTPSQSALTSALAGGGMVTFAFNGTITLTSAENISANTVIDGSGYNVIISGGNTSQIFKIGSGVNLTITNLTLENGLTTTNGGAIYNLGTLIAGNCTFNDNYARGPNGTSGTTSGQSGAAGGSVNGGAIYSAGDAVFEGCTFCTNDAVAGYGGNGYVGQTGYSASGGGAGGAGGTSQGGAIYSAGTIAITNCYFLADSSTGGAGGAGAAGGLDTGNGLYEAAGAGGAGGQGNGAGLFTTGNSTVVQSTFSNNSGTGGASGNSGSIGGPINGTGGNVGGNSCGAGICNTGTNITINCTFYSDTMTAGLGGIGGNGQFNGSNGGHGGNAYGGGIYNSSVAGITNCTFSSDILVGGNGGSGGTGPDNNGSSGATGAAAGGAIENASGSLTLKNSIIAYSSDTGGSGTVGNGSGTIADAGNNISSDSSVTLSGSGSHANTDPLLLPLANNGGLTETCALQPTSPAINAGNDAAAPFTDQRGYFRVGTSDIGAYEYGASGMYVAALGYTASLNGNVGLFLIGGLYTPSPIPLNVSYTMGGTASNGVDYNYITNLLTIPAGSDYAIVLVQGIPGAFSVTNKTVSLTINSWNNVIVTNSSETLILYPNNTYDLADQYVRGTSTAPDYQSFVLPMDSETGVPLDNIGGNATNLFPGNTWTNTLYHFNATNLVSQTNITGRIPFQNPIVAFGDTVGGSSLYLNHNYSFTIASGFPDNYSNALSIQVYYRSNSAYAGAINLTIPESNSNQLMNLVTNGFTQTYTGFGLQTTVLFTDSIDWQTHGLQWGESFTLTHEASAEATNYYYVVEDEGYGPYQYLVLNETNSVAPSPLYVMEFSPYPAGLSTFLTQPQFNGLPMPSIYEGDTLQELTNVQAVLPNLSYLNPSNYLTLDDSPELRRHPILDQFVANMNNDPIALANYVVNQIGLVDGIDFNTNATMQSSINLGGVNRSALDTFQEGQGSPMEQCALLVYLLRQAGVPAAYVFPTNNGLQMLSSQMSEILQCQLTGALNYYGQTNIPTLLNVNYPWVTAYIGTNWVQIFPWIKDTEITEGFNLYDYMPTNYNSGYKWLTHFIANDTNIFSLSGSDQPLVLLPLFIQNSLNQNYPGMSVSDLGMQILNRQHLYSQWADFPKPFALNGTPTVIESLSTNTNLFNTLEVQVYSQANPSKLIDTGEMYAADLHNRMILLQFQQVGATNVHNMILSLEPYSTNYTSVTSFGANANPCWGLSSTNQLDSTDNGIVFQITQRRDRFLPPGATTNVVADVQYYDYSYTEFGQQGASQVYQNSYNYSKGDLVAFAFDDGLVSQKMLNVHAQQIWQYNQSANTNVPSTLNPNIYLGETTYLMAMSYFNYNDQFRKLDSLLHKVNVTSWYQEGFGLLRPERNSAGALVNGGNVIPITPAVNMPINAGAAIFNFATMANLNNDLYATELSWYLQLGVQGSAAEHGALRSFYGTNAISTVKLLQQAGTNTVLLDPDNYVAAGQVSYHGVKLMNSDTNMWATITGFFAPTNYYGDDFDEEVFMTPGVMTNGTYVGVGALLMNEYYMDSAVGGLNGGIGDSLAPTTFSADNSPNLTVNPAPDGSVTPFQLVTTSTSDNSGNSGTLVDGSTPIWQLSDTSSSLADGQTQLDPTLNSSMVSLSSLYGTEANAPAVYNQLYNTGTSSTTTPVYSDWTQSVADPVNMMTGEFYIDAPDISLPGPMPLQIRRNYGSQNLAENEFGFGWKMSYAPFLSVGTNSTLIYAAEMDGTVVAYRRTVTNTNLWLPQPQDNPMLNNNNSIGIGSIGNLYNNHLQLSVVSGTNTYALTGADGSVRTFTEQSYPVGTFTRQRPYLNKWQDSKGNFYTFQYGNDSTQPDYGEVNRIQSSNGNYVGFYYDVSGQIIQAYTGDGRWLQYVYDQYGDLTSVTLPDETEIDYVYQHTNQVTSGVTNVYSTHLIVEEDKPDGRVLQNLYDSQRRVTNQLSTAGVSLAPILTTTFVYTNNFSLNTPTNPVTGVTAISDYYNHATTYYYTNSLVQKIVDPLNQNIVQTWYQTNGSGGFQRSLASRVDKRGLLTTYLYDAYGNLTNTVVTGDLTGNGIPTQTATNTAIYNTNNLPVQITDPVGNSMVVVYDPVFNFLPQQVIRYAGAISVSTNLMIYGDATNIVIDGSLTRTNTAFGVLMRRIRAYDSLDAATNDSLCNGQGFPTNTILYSGTDDPNVTNQLFYDERDELVQRTDAAGDNYTFAFDPMGRKTAQETYAAGQTVPMDFDFWYYDDNGELDWIDGPRYNPEDYIFYDYDGAGRVTTEIHWQSEANSSGTGVEAPAGYNQYAQAFNQYDPLGNLLIKTDPRGAVTTNAYDAICRLVQTSHVDVNGTTMLSTEGFSYEPGGQVQSHTNALGGVTTTYYTTTGKPEYQINADGSTNGWRYYLDGRIYQKIQSNGAYWQTTYDDVNRITTQVFYSAAGVPETTNSTQLDRRGNLVQKVDAEGNVFTTAFDGLDRPKVTAGPAIVTVSTLTGMSPTGPVTYVTNVLQQVSTNFYDAAGLALTNVNALGEITISLSDAIGRPVSKQIYGSSGTLAHETYLAYSADHNSVTVTNGSGANAIVNTAYTDTAGHTVLAIAYPSANATEFTLNQYDLDENLVSSQHDSSSGGAVTNWTTATSTFDGLNRKTSEVDRDGALTTYAYDSLNDLTNRTIPGGLQWLATYNDAGQILQEQISGGGENTRTNIYAYYPSGNAFAGLLDTETSGRGLVSTHSYDDQLRTTSITRTTVNYNHVDTFWSYDVRGYVTNITEQYTGYSEGADPKVVLRNYDPYGQMTSELVTMNGTNLSNAGQTWDASGRRTGLNINGINYTFGWRADGVLTSASDSSGNASYNYDTAGLLTNRTVGVRSTTITSRDGEGRPLSIATTVNLLMQLTELLTWSGDGLLTSDTLERSDFTDSRSYAYADLSRRLALEQLNLNGSTSWTNDLAYDSGVTAGPGVLTQIGQPGSSLWTGGVSPFARINTETNTSISYPALGRINGEATLSAYLDSQPLSTEVYPTGNPSYPYQWRTVMELTPGAHQLKVAALHPSGFYTAWATNSFTNNVANQNAAILRDADGNIEQYTWYNPDGSINRAESLYWDAKNRLTDMNCLDASGNGYDVHTEYDGLNRRLLTECYPIVENSFNIYGPNTTINQFYDPNYEFLELGVAYGTKAEWKLYGPDLNGVYGGLNGTGGFDAVSPGLNLFNPVISDFRGNILAEVTNGVVAWTAARPTGYGAVSGYRPVALGHGADLAQSSAWRGHWVDISGYYQIGMRLYDPVAGHWLSYDSDWNERDPNYLTFAGGDPINGFDADGRLSNAFYNYQYNNGGISSLLNGVGSALNDYSGDNSFVGTSTAFAGTLFNEAGAATSPSTYVNGAESFGNNISTVYQSDGLLAAGSYATTSWNVGAIWSGYNNINLATGGPVGDGLAQAEDILSGISGTAGVVAPVGSWGTATVQSAINNSISDSLLSQFNVPGVDNAGAATGTGNFTQANVESAIGSLTSQGIQTSATQSSIDPNQVINIAQAMQAGTFQNELMDSPVIFDTTSQAYLSGNHRAIAAEMTGFELEVNSIPIGAESQPFSNVPLQPGRVNPPIIER
jgi:RHS repeat-associated protein